MPVVAKLRVIDVEELILEIVAAVGTFVADTDIPTTNLLESATVRVVVPEEAEHVCFVLILTLHSEPSSPANRDEINKLVLSSESFWA